MSGRLISAAFVFLFVSLGSAFAQPESGTVFTDCEGCPEMVVVPAGTFMMGSTSDEIGRDPKEGPQHQVTIPGTFAVGRFEVSVGEFRHFVETAGYRPRGTCYGDLGSSIQAWSHPGFAQDNNQPVVCISWDDAQAYVSWLSETTGAYYRLLSEAEWEYVARAGTTTPYSWGEDADRDRMNVPGYRGDRRWIRTVPVGTFEANAFGLYGVHGNVWEYVQDCWNRRYRGAPSDGSAWEHGDCRYRMARGGSWDSQPREARSASRRKTYQVSHTEGDNDVGFRVARDLN